MTQTEYQEWKDDPRVGKCPFCEAPGWIVGDREWCTHYLGSKDDLGPGVPESGALESIPLLDKVLEFSYSLFDELTTEQIHGLTDLKPEDREILQVCFDFGPTFWHHLIPVETLYAEVSSSLYDTSYTSYFTPDPDSSIPKLEAKVSRAMNSFSKHPVIGKLIDPET